MTYDEIYKPLSRTSFASKMEYAFRASVEVMSHTGQVEVDVLQTKFLPYEIETFVMNSIVTKEYSETKMTDRQFLAVMNAIRSFQPPEYYEKLKTDGLKWVLPTIGAVQFESQQYILFRLYRHHCLFSFTNEKVDVATVFIEKFSHSFDDFAAIVLTFQALLAEREIIACKDYLGRICRNQSWFVDNLSMTREQYKEELSQFASSSADYKYCLRPSYSYPFIKDQGTLYLPTPHLLIQSITTAMMNRLTFENPGLREKIGKNACESYLLKIVTDSDLFDEVVPEYEYAKGHRTLDVLTRKDNVAVLIDSKLFSPKVTLRTYDDEAYKNDEFRIVNAIKKTYNQMHYKFIHEYYPFSCEVEEVYALVVVYQEGYLDLGEIYKQVAQELSITEDSSEFEWLWHHVGFTEIASIERFLLTKTDIIPELKNRDGMSDKWLTGRNGADCTEEIQQYHDRMISVIDESSHALFCDQK